jgi:hypothetical protein
MNDGSKESMRDYFRKKKSWIQLKEKRSENAKDLLPLDM